MLKKFRPTLKRIVALAVFLALATHLALALIGLSYMNAIESSLKEKRGQAMLDQFSQNVLYQLNDIDNLLLLLQTPEFSDYYKDLMGVRDEAVADAGKRVLEDKLSELKLDNKSLHAVYFLGRNLLERSMLKIVDEYPLKIAPRLDMDRFHYSKLDDLFLRNHNRLTVYTKEDLEAVFQTTNPMLEKEDIADLQAFIEEIAGHPVLSNGYENGVLTMILLKDDFLNQLLPERLPDGSSFTLIGHNGRTIWSNSPEQAPFTTDGQSPNRNGKLHRDFIRTMDPLGLSIVYSEEQAPAGAFQSKRFQQLILVSIATLLAVLQVCYLYLRQVFKPYRQISRQIKSFTKSNEWLLRPLPENMSGGAFHSIRMKNKLILMLSIAVCTPAVVDGLIYNLYSQKDMQSGMDMTTDVLWKFSAVSLGNRLRFTENTLNEISASTQFQKYFLENVTHPSQSVMLTSFPGLNEIAYFVFLDKSGASRYSSIFTNNKDMFNADRKYLLDTDAPYWISEYKSIFSPLSTALAKRMRGSEDSVSYFLMVPKESVFEIASPGNLGTPYTIVDNAGKTIYESRTGSDRKMPQSNTAWSRFYAGNIPGSAWTLTARFEYKDLLDQNRAYQQQFLLLLLIVLLLSVVLATAIGHLLVKPIQRLQEKMKRASAGELKTLPEEESGTEIAGIIASYNRMVRKLDQLMREESELVSLKTKAELAMLQAQINPHFLYNTLEVINLKSIKSGNLEVSQLVHALADLFRYSIAEGSEIVRLDQELAHVQNYVTIQQVRFGHSFEVRFEVPDEVRAMPIMRFTLQPIVENAIKHGFAGWSEGGLVVVEADSSNGRLLLSIRDNGIGMDRQTLEQLRADLTKSYGEKQSEAGGIGIRNVYQRLKLIYKEGVSMSIESEDFGGTEINVQIPLQTP